MPDIEQIIITARDLKCSDVHISEGLPMAVRIHGKLQQAPFQLNDHETREAILSMIPDPMRTQLEAGEDLDFAVQTSDGHRQRINVFRQQGKLAATIRLLNSTIPTLEELGLPPVLRLSLIHI